MGIYWDIYGIWMGYYWLVGGFNLPLWKMMEWKSVGMTWHSQLNGKIKNVPNHQPGIHRLDKQNEERTLHSKSPTSTQSPMMFHSNQENWPEPCLSTELPRYCQEFVFKPTCSFCVLFWVEHNHWLQEVYIVWGSRYILYICSCRGYVYSYISI
jgi:hypothetical protein